jgi:hypothetical protein
MEQSNENENKISTKNATSKDFPMMFLCKHFLKIIPILKQKPRKFLKMKKKE